MDCKARILLILSAETLTVLTDTELEILGNELFTSKKFEGAVQCYTNAIVGISLEMIFH